MILQTHLLRIPLKGKELPSALHSLVYACLPEDKMITANDLTEAVKRNKDNEFLKNTTAIHNVVRQLLEMGCLAEFHGIKLAKLLNVKI